jgi:hypothetical protein
LRQFVRQLAKQAHLLGRGKPLGFLARAVTSDVDGWPLRHNQCPVSPTSMWASSAIGVGS